MEWYIKVLKNYAEFTGRASRKEYWMFALFNIIISIGLGILGGVLQNVTRTNQGILGNIYSLAVLVPSIAVAIRRMHDTGRSGWWCIVPIANLIFACESSQPGSNKYGSNPNEKSQI
jgi:uncharacterized membrane protein YhaH (DUF805 family)